MTNKTILEAQAEALQWLLDQRSIYAQFGLLGMAQHANKRIAELRAQAAAEQPEKEGEQARFEAWMETHDSDALVFKDSTGKYLNAYTQDRWGMWQVAAQFNLSAHHPDSGEWQWVPKEPTEEMAIAAIDAPDTTYPGATQRGHAICDMRNRLRIALDAAPKDQQP